MSNPTVKDLRDYMELSYNILLQGDHGTGKTTMLREAAQQLGLRVKYMSASTLDPFTDLVGIPVPVENEDGVKVLESIRPHTIDDAEVIFFDEFNRADIKTLNAVFEIIQFHTINGEPLPKLRCVIAAQNPPDSGYSVDTLDAALVDRFDVVLNVAPKPLVSYFTTALAPHGGDRQVATALTRWWNENQGAAKALKGAAKDDRKNYVSPRRLETIGKVFLQTMIVDENGKKEANAKAIEAALPPGGVFDSSKLITFLNDAVRERLAGGDLSKFDSLLATKDPSEIRQMAVQDLLDTWDDLSEKSQTRVVAALSTQVNPERLTILWGPLLSKFSTEQFGDLTKNWQAQKKSLIRVAVYNKEKCTLDSAAVKRLTPLIAKAN